MSSPAAVSPAASRAARYPASRARLDHSSSGPPMMAMRRCPSSIRWRVAVRQPCQFVVPTDRMPGPGSPGGSITTSGMRAAASRCSSPLSGRFSTVSAPSVPRAVARFSQAVKPPGESTVLTTTLAPASSAACTVPRSSSSAHGAVQGGDEQVHDAEAEPGRDLVPVPPEQRGDPGPGRRGHVGPPVEHLGHRRHRHARLRGDARQRAAPGLSGHGSSSSTVSKLRLALQVKQREASS